LREKAIESNLSLFNQLLKAFYPRFLEPDANNLKKAFRNQSEEVLEQVLILTEASNNRKLFKKKEEMRKHFLLHGSNFEKKSSYLDK